MASSGGGGAASAKISPRKFSEKIALLNKKEAEGNAQFEEIIKEVQATRSQSACGLGAVGNGGAAFGAGRSSYASDIHYMNNVASNRNDDELASLRQRERRDELEEVFENLIKCVGQYEQELQEEQQQQQQQQQQRAGVTFVSQATFAIGDNLDADDRSAVRPASVELGNGADRYGHDSRQQLAATSIPAANSARLPLSNGNLSNSHDNSRDLSTTNNNTSISHHYAPSATKHAFSGSANSFYAQGAAPMGFGRAESGSIGSPQAAAAAAADAAAATTTGRARVTSFGSASCRYANTGTSSAGHHQQAPANHRAHHLGHLGQVALHGDGRATICGGAGGAGAVGGANPGDCGGMFLEPACDRSWQKSCSDPTLHVPCVRPVSSGNFDTSCSDLSEQSAGGAPSAGGDAQLVGVAACSAPNGGQLQQQQLEQHSLGPDSMLHQSPSASYRGDEPLSLAAQQAASGGELSGACPAGSATGAPTAPSANQEQLYCDNSNMSLMSDLPGIQICTFDEDNSASQHQQRQAAAAVRPESRDNSLPDIANLQFSNVPSGEKLQHRQQSAALPTTTASPNAGLATDSGGQRRVEQAGSFQNGFQSRQHDEQQRQLCQRPTIAQSPSHSPPGQAGPDSYNNPASTLQAASSPTDWGCAMGGQPGTTTSSSNISASGAGSQVPLCAPRVSSLLSSSDCGLTWSNSNHHSHNLAAGSTLGCPAANSSAGSMFRSHSHNSIDYLTKQRLPAQQFQQPQPQPQPAHPQYQHQHQHQRQHQHQLQHQLQLQSQQQMQFQQHQQPRLQYHQLEQPLGPDPASQYSAHTLYSQPQPASASSLNGGHKFVGAGSQQQADSMSPPSNLSSPLQSELSSPAASSSGDYTINDLAGPFCSQAQPNEHQQEPVYLMPRQQQQACYAPAGAGQASSPSNGNPYQQQQQQIMAVQQQHQQVLQQQQFGGSSEAVAMGAGCPPALACAAAGGPSSIGPCPSPSAARRLHNQAARGPTYSPFSQLSRSSNPSCNNTTGSGAGNC